MSAQLTYACKMAAILTCCVVAGLSALAIVCLCAADREPDRFTIFQTVSGRDKYVEVSVYMNQQMRDTVEIVSAKHYDQNNDGDEMFAYQGKLWGSESARFLFDKPIQAVFGVDILFTLETKPGKTLKDVQTIMFQTDDAFYAVPHDTAR